ncbi:MAG: phosphatase PAP2 family protein [Clostridia bacterium]|nr:phosphatase PAP2 family protein [Clostridia bacterium]
MSRKHTACTASIVIPILFILWTVAVRTIGRQPVGPLDSTIGLSRLNIRVHNAIGVHLFLYNLTDFLSLLPLGIMALNAVNGLMQWIRRKDLRKVDRTIIALGLLYAVLFTVFITFELFPVNFRPVLIEGKLEASYPSSTTMLALSVMILEVQKIRLTYRKTRARRVAEIGLLTFGMFMVIARILSGVHWITDIIGGLLICGSLAAWYTYITDKGAR